MAAQLVIDGDLRAAAQGATLPVEDPSTGEVIREVPLGGAPDADAALDAARRAADSGPWPRMAPAERADVLRVLGRLVTARAD